MIGPIQPDVKPTSPARQPRRTQTASQRSSAARARRSTASSRTARPNTRRGTQSTKSTLGETRRGETRRQTQRPSRGQSGERRRDRAKAASRAWLARLPFAERVDGRRLLRTSLRVGLGLALVWGLLLAGREVYEYATTSARFEARHFIYEPSPHVDDEALRELLALEPGTNILALDLEQLGERITAHPWVAEATVVRSLPDTLEISVREHVPAAMVLAERFYLVDGEGRPFKAVEAGERGELPVISGIDRSWLRDDRERAVAEIARGLAVLDRYRAKQRPRLSEIHLGSDGSVTLYTAEAGTQLNLGREHHGDRLERWDALRRALGARADGLAVVHLDQASAPDRRERVVARFADTRDEDLLLATAEAQLSEGRQASDETLVDPAAAAAPSPAERAGQRSRMPRYE